MLIEAICALSVTLVAVSCVVVLAQGHVDSPTAWAALVGWAFGMLVLLRGCVVREGTGELVAEEFRYLRFDSPANERRAYIVCSVQCVVLVVVGIVVRDSAFWVAGLLGVVLWAHHLVGWIHLVVPPQHTTNPHDEPHDGAERPPEL